LAPTAWKNILRASLPAILLAGLMIAFYFKDPVEVIFIHCPFYQLTKLHCPGCGSLRALYHLAHIDLAQALSMNALTVMLLPAVFWLVAQDLRGQFYPLPAVPGKFKVFFGWLVVVLVFSFWIVRNVPVYPFSTLAPG